MADKNYTIKLQLRKDTEANFTSSNPVLLDGEMVIVTNIGENNDIKLKIGDGTSNFTQLSYLETGSEDGGKTLYELAQENGYTGTEQEFTSFLTGGPYLPTAGGTMNGFINFPTETGEQMAKMKGGLFDTLTEPDANGNMMSSMYPSLGIIGLPVIIQEGLAVNNKVIGGVATPVKTTDAANKKYVDDSVSAVTPATIGAVPDTVTINGQKLEGAITISGGNKNVLSATQPAAGTMSAGDIWYKII